MKSASITTLYLLASACVALATEPAKTARDFPLHNVTSAPEASKAITQRYVEKINMVPNIVGMMAESPALLRSYRATQQNLTEHGTLTAAQNNVVQMAVSWENECFY